MEKKTKRKTLERCLDYLTRLKLMDSKDHLGLEPIDEEAEESFMELDQDCRNVRELIQALESEPVRQVIANWQVMIMADPRYARENAMKF